MKSFDIKNSSVPYLPPSSLQTFHKFNEIKSGSILLTEYDHQFIDR